MRPVTTLRHAANYAFAALIGLVGGGVGAAFHHAISAWWRCSR